MANLSDRHQQLMSSSDTRITGTCGVKLVNGRYCAREPLVKDSPTNHRCLKHQLQPSEKAFAANTHNSLYAKRLKSAFVNPADRKLFATLERNTSVEHEIAVWRVKVAQLTQLSEHTDVERANYYLSLLAKATEMLNKLIATQSQQNQPTVATAQAVKITIGVDNAAAQNALAIDVDDIDASHDAPMAEVEETEAAEELDDFESLAKDD